MVDSEGRRVNDNATIQCFLRWRSDEAVRIYGRLNPGAYSSMLQRAVLADVSSVRTTNAHRHLIYDSDAVAAQMEKGLTRMYAQAQAEDAGEEEPLEDIDDEELSPDNL